MDNSKGYILENVNACCCECNLIKKDYIYEDLINKFLLIHKKHYVPIESLEVPVNIEIHVIENNKPEMLENKVIEINNRHLVVNKNKKTKEEMREANRLYKQKQREKMKEKYGDEEYKKIRAKEIAEGRSKRKENNN